MPASIVRHLSTASLIPAIALLSFAPLALVPSGRVIAAETVVADDDGPGSGTLLLTGPGIATALPAVRLGSDMDVTVTGTVARVVVTQAFRNSGTRWAEARYLYPLPEGGAVDTLKMVVGQRVIVGRIERRADARAIYEAAKTDGRKAGLVEQQRPNMFTTSVANVGPGETVLVRIEYQMPVRQDASGYALRLPLVVAPRYVPPRTLGTPAAVADAKVVTSGPVLHPALGPINPTSITVHLQPGFMTANVVSRYHRVRENGPGDNRTITLATGDVPADRDFELDWRSASAEPTVGLFREHTDAADYVMASVAPPADLSHVPTPPREMVFVIDNSGSMGGQSMEEAKAALVHALNTLGPRDTFNVIRFDDTLTQLFPRSVGATPDQVAKAVGFAQGLAANGGTEMLPALTAALSDARASGGPRVLRQIVFLTDGEISNEQEMLATLARDGGKSHVFMVGIGSAPNDYLMTRMATTGRGTYTHIGAITEVAARTTALLDVLKHPAVQDLTVSVDGTAIDWTPRHLPDLYAGEPLTLVGRTRTSKGTMTVGGTIGGRRWTRTLELGSAATSPAVARLWARRRIDDVEADRTLGVLDDAAADGKVEDLGLTYGIVTGRTSLVAVDETPTRPAGQMLTREDLPLNLPSGWDFDTLFGGAAGKAAAANANTLAEKASAQAAERLALPQTATGFVATLMQGLGLLIAGAAGLFALRRKRVAA